ncbi:dCTP deaminase domain-containing protein [Kitasatospora sp. NBC_01266]|uniref:dCTP deaminase domain-containing protein n=1 Tax=Kitasatospora sp. NBC_01266 TaxID=2903572 RepID=UPI002E307259|nr:PEP/pyruvate-binding domain-containing protein [Kitasatospora sp. NBC_01266]
MILTGSEIARERSNGRITIDPFVPEQVNPNSYNFRLGNRLRVYTDPPLDPRTPNAYEELEIPAEGYVLEPGRLYLAHTEEVLGSRYYAPTFAARSSVARLGLFINLSASLGDIGFEGQWTLQLYALNRLRVYPGMNIGQMMWWCPLGEIELYEGKYQGSVGPRSSDIHRDFEKTATRLRFPGLGADSGPELVGGKFAALSTASRSFPVPAAFAVPAAEFAAALDPEDARLLAEQFAELRATVGAFFTESAELIGRTAARVALAQETRRLLTLRLRDVFGELSGRRFAVRSSGLDEDGATASLAGVHQSLLDVVGPDGVLDAIEECWRSYYAPPAIAARVRAGDFDSAPRLAVIVQELVDAQLAGVAFTGLDAGSQDITIEYVEGLAEELMAGAAAPYRLTAAEVPALPVAHAEVLREVIRLTGELRAARGHDVDVEWAADRRGVHLLQVRRVTARRTRPAESPFWTSRLYFENPPAGAPLREVAAVYAGYSAKRGPAHRLAGELGVQVGRGWVVGFTGAGLHDPANAERLDRTLAEGRSPSCVLDFGDTLRQIVVPRREVLRRLIEVSGATAGSDREHAVIVRDFVRGDLGVISRRAGADLVVEYTPDGLLALNRGTAGAEAIVVDAAGAVCAPDSAAPVLRHLDAIDRFTTAMQARYGEVTLEWVLDGDALLFVDYSVLGADALLTGGEGVRISDGAASGPLLTLSDDELLRRLSIGPAVSIDKSKDVTEYAELARLLDKVRGMPEPPVVRASRPYAVLSVLIGSVAGFVFEQGSALCHLAILLREEGVPAVAATGLDEAPDGAQAAISAGTITVASTSRSHDV